MNEKPDKNLQKEWNKILRSQGLPSRLRLQEKVPITTSAKDILSSLIEGIDVSLEQFKKLEKSFQKGILEDLISQRDAKVKPKAILDRFYYLLEQSQNLEQMDVGHSDKEHKDEVPESEVEPEIEEDIGREVDRLIDRVASIINDEREKDDQGSNLVN